MVAAYNGVLAHKNDLDEPTKQQSNAIRGKIIKILTYYGVASPNRGDNWNIGNNQPGFSWRTGNLFIGVVPERRADDPKEKHEFDKNSPKEDRLNIRFGENKTIWTEMQRIQVDTTSALRDTSKGLNAEKFESGELNNNNLFITNAENQVNNINWAVKSGDWGAPGVDFYLK